MKLTGDNLVPLKYQNSLQTKMNNLIENKEIITQIFYIRGIKVMLDFHLAAMCEVETRVLNQTVQRNRDRFPEDFLFQLSETEFKDLMSQFVISKNIDLRP